MAEHPARETLPPRRPSHAEPHVRRVSHAAYVPQAAPRRAWRQNLIGGCLAIGGALTSFGCIAGILAFLLLPSVYRAQRPEIQTIWCSRAERVGMDFVCDWKPTPPFDVLPTVGGPTVDPLDLLATLGVATATPNPSSNLNITAAPVVNAELAQAPTPTFPLTLTPTASPTLTFTPTLSVTNTPTLTPSATPYPLPASYKLDLRRIRYHAQTWNNCGAATLSMGLSFFGYANNQSVAASFLKPNREDKNVSPEEMVSYTNQRASQIVGVNGLVRVGGDLTLLKTLLANNFPVIIEKGYDVEDLGWMGHYLLIVGYDDAQAVFFTYDSYLGHGNSQGLRETYADIEFYWKHFNYTFILLYAPERQAEALALLGSRATEQGALEYALATAQAATSVNPSDNWAWFNMGTAFTRLGQYDRAAPAFDQAFALGMPWRTLWYLHDPYLAYYALGRYDDILANAQATENTTPYVEETFYYRAAVLAARGDTNGAVRQLDLALTYNSNYQNARILKNALQNASFTPEMVVALASAKGG